MAHKQTSIFAYVVLLMFSLTFYVQGVERYNLAILDAMTYAEKNEQQLLTQVKELITKGANVNKSIAEITPLIYAARKGFYNLVKLFVETNRNSINSRDFSGWTALMHAAYTNQKIIVEFLLKNGADISIKEEIYGKNAYDLAIKKRHQEIADLIKKYEDKYKKYIMSLKLSIIYSLEKSGLPKDTIKEIIKKSIPTYQEWVEYFEVKPNQ